jgi:hypothetical protein
MGLPAMDFAGPEAGGAALAGAASPQARRKSGDVHLMGPENDR